MSDQLSEIEFIDGPFDGMTDKVSKSKTSAHIQRYAGEPISYYERSSDDRFRWVVTYDRDGLVLHERPNA